MFGNYYAYDALNPVVDLLRDQRGFSYGQIGALSTTQVSAFGTQQMAALTT